MDLFDEGVEAIVRLLSDESTTMTGSHVRLTNARCEPKPLQRPHPPIAIGGRGRRRTLRTVARWAQHWNCLTQSPADWRELRDVLDAHCADVGRDPSEIESSVNVRYERDPERLRRTATSYVEAGVADVIVAVAPPYDVADVHAVADAIARS
jgi:alkanesulfonate monooxygenase SsuD/methylene tetrahydromethanopterin reductase-like flavin-dependent oxidoreductase (luciferase family)